jgi:hypothetical protein
MGWCQHHRLGQTAGVLTTPGVLTASACVVDYDGTNSVGHGLCCDLIPPIIKATIAFTHKIHVMAPTSYTA